MAEKTVLTNWVTFFSVENKPERSSIVYHLLKAKLPAIKTNLFLL